MWELDCEESWASKNWCFWTVVLEKTLESPLDCKEIQPVHSEGDQPWDFFGGNDAEAETPVLWPPDAKSWLTGRLWCWEIGDDRGWDGWMASSTRWTWVWVNSGSWWWTGRPGVLRFTGSQRVGHDWLTELTDWLYRYIVIDIPVLSTLVSLSDERLWFLSGQMIWAEFPAHVTTKCIKPRNSFASQETSRLLFFNWDIVDL